MKPAFILAVSSAALLAACGGDGAKTSGGSAGVTAPRLEGFCQVAGLPSPLRQTVVVIDQSQVRVVSAAEQFRTANPELFQLMLGLGDPAQSIDSGAMAARERLTVYLAPSDGAAPRVIFSGCEPGTSAADKKRLAVSKSGAAKMTDAFFGKGPTQAAQEAGEHFRTALIGALQNVSSDAAAATPPAALLDRSLARSLQAVPQLASIENGIPRLFFFTDLVAFAPDGVTTVEQARARGFDDADKAHLSLGMAEVHVVGPKPARSSLTQDYARAFFLGSQGRLLSWGGAAFNSLPPAPVKVESYAGEITYAPDNFPMQMRLAADRNGELVNSWIVVKKERSIATPLTGSYICDADQACRVTTDQGGLAQAWARQGGPDPVFNQSLPLAGLRQLSAQVRGDTMQGRVFDPIVGKIGSTTGLEFKLTRSPQGPGAASTNGG